MYKIYINGNCLVLADKSEAQLFDKETVTIIPFLSGKKALLNYIDKLEKSPDSLTLVLMTNDVKALFREYRSLYKVIKAAGGLCQNDQDEILFIERLGVWDLPKGKIDPGESNEEAAIREVEEETGLTSELGEKVGVSWHTYYDQKKRRILKKTTWFRMKVSSTSPVKIQVEENITDFRWLTAAQFLSKDLSTYPSIREIVQIFSKTSQF